MHRFFIAPEFLAHPLARLSLPDKMAHQLRDVLHLEVGEHLILLDNSGEEVLCEVTKSHRAGVEVQMLERYAGKPESPVRIILCQGLLKSARFEWILEKGTELGVATFVPMLCRRSMAGLEDAGPSKIQRWQRIIQEAAEQCGRSRLPELWPICPLQHALSHIPVGAQALMPWEEEHGQSLREALRVVAAKHMETMPSSTTVVLLIGPEGGLMSEEVTLAQRQGVQTVTLGTRILRAETAALTAVANVMYELEAQWLRSN